jgi:hypothetical protein
VSIRSRLEDATGVVHGEAKEFMNIDPWHIGVLTGVSIIPVGLAQQTQECPECGEPLPTIRKPSNWRQALWGGWSCPNCGSELDRWGRTIARGGGGAASDPGDLTISHAKLRVLRPDLYGLRGLHHRLRELTGLTWPQRTYLAKHLQNGDSRAALVVSTNPLRVAAYTDELDCVAILMFPDEFVKEYALRDGSRLLTINTYNRGREYDHDLVLGPAHKGNWTGFHPIIAEFVSDDLERINNRKKAIADDEWQRAYRMGKAYLREWPANARDGRPVFAGLPAQIGQST